MKRFISFLACFLFALCTGTACIGDKGGDDAVNHVNVGDKAPTFTVDPPDGAEWEAFTSPDGFIDRKSLLVLFDPLCPDCKELLPTIEAVWEGLVRDNGEQYRLVNISRQRTGESAELWQTQEFTMPYWLDPDRKVFAMFATMTVPRIYLIGADGKVRNMFIEKYDFTAEWLMDELKKLE